LTNEEIADREWSQPKVMVKQLLISQKQAQTSALKEHLSGTRCFAAERFRGAANWRLSQATGSGGVKKRLIGLTITNWVGKEQRGNLDKRVKFPQKLFSFYVSQHNTSPSSQQ
jgi:hypothetical protein